MLSVTNKKTRRNNEEAHFFISALLRSMVGARVPLGRHLKHRAEAGVVTNRLGSGRAIKVSLSIKDHALLRIESVRTPLEMVQHNFFPSVLRVGQLENYG